MLRRLLKDLETRLHGAAGTAAFVERALAFFAEHGIAAKRLMTDNAFTYADNAFTYVHNPSLANYSPGEGSRHLRTEPYRPRTNGEVERFHQTMARK